MPENPPENPIELFAKWYKEAQKHEINDANAMTLASCDANGMPNARIVLLKDFSVAGFVFYTNLTSQKGVELAQNPKAALCFHWKSLQRQVRIKGIVEPVEASQADAYFASRPRLSRIGAWASKQSSVLSSRFELEKRVAKYTAKFPFGEIPRPDFWSGFCLVPQSIEFWQAGDFRLHNRDLFYRSSENPVIWQHKKLFP